MDSITKSSITIESDARTNAITDDGKELIYFAELSWGAWSWADDLLIGWLYQNINWNILIIIRGRGSPMTDNLVIHIFSIEDSDEVCVRIYDYSEFAQFYIQDSMRQAN